MRSGRARNSGTERQGRLTLRDRNSFFVLAVPAVVAVLGFAPADYLELQDHPLRRLGKTFVFTEQMAPDDLAVLRKLNRVSVRVVMKGNMLRDSWVTALDALNLERTEVVVAPPLNRQHVNQLKRLRNLHVSVDLGGARLTPALAREMDALGPIRKTVMIGPSFTKTSLDRLAGLKNIEIMLDAREGELSSEDLSMLEDLPIVKRLLVRSTLPVAELRRFEGKKNLILVVEVDRDVLQDETANALSSLKVPVVLRVSDALDDEKYRALFVADGFDLEVTPVDPGRVRQRLLDMLKRTDP